MKKILFILLTGTLLLNGCGDNFFVGNEGCGASDGAHSDHIAVSWGEFMVTDDETDEEIYPVSYELYRSDDSYTTPIETTTGTSYNDYDVTPGVVYYYKAKAIYENSTEAWSDSDSGFAMNATVLQIGPAYGDYYETDSTNTTAASYAWFEVMIQGGWNYTIETYGGTISDTTLQIYHSDDLETAVATDYDSGTGNHAKLTGSYTTSGIYYIAVLGDADNGEFNITMWYHQ